MSEQTHSLDHHSFETVELDHEGFAGHLMPDAAYKALQSNSEVLLVDVRTRAEWQFVGIPSIGEAQITLSEWQHYPTMELNPSFLDQVAARVDDKQTPIFLICRSGVRSIAAAKCLTEAGYTQAYNILHGFEGDPDQAGHRGTQNGWKSQGLPWHQG